MEATKATDEQKQVFMPYLMAISAKIGEIKQETVLQMAKDYAEQSEDFVKKMTENFEASDANKDGVLDANEFVTFEKNRAAFQKEKYGECVSFTDDEYKDQYQFFQALNPGTEGVSFNDLLVANQIYVETSQ